MHSLETVIFPVAGLGTRMLPATKSVPKELLPVYDTPLLQLAIDEALAAGARRLVFVSHPSKPGIQDYVTADPDLRAKLVAKQKTDLVRSLDRAAVADKVETHFVFQQTPLGLGHAVQCAAGFRNGGPVGVILPDDVILGAPCLSEMAAAYAPQTARHMVATMRVDDDTISRYGVFELTGQSNGASMMVSGMVEKPAPEKAPSNYAAVGRYLLDDSIFDHLDGLAPGLGGEIQLTDAIAQAQKTEGLCAFAFSGTRYDCGNREGLFQAASAYRELRLGDGGASGVPAMAMAAE
ncbi:MAG: sugar phosphate nucleotidyltransferase [Rhodobacteraceae bacterium]|nr:sugar phosphate nucleotidyltransferase [Paracoccaceae bacterium]